MAMQTAGSRAGSHGRTGARGRLAAVALACLLAGPVSADSTDAPCSGKPIVVKIHADWCATCKALDSVWTQLNTDMGDRITTVVFDVSDRIAYQESQERANELGLTEFFENNRSKTGTIAILDCRSRDPVAILNGERDLGKYLDAIARASDSS
jgi:thiol-disulfide isomerase/thioredoxin